MKRAQIAGQTFTYIMAAIIIALIVGLGYYGFQKITDVATDVRLSKFKTDIAADLAIAAVKTGSISLSSYPLPKEISTVCFYGTAQTTTPSPQFSPLIQDAITSDPTDAVFIMGDGIFDRINLPGTKMEAVPVCYDVSNSILRLRLIGHGRFVEVTKQTT